MWHECFGRKLTMLNVLIIAALVAAIAGVFVCRAGSSVEPMVGDAYRACGLNSLYVILSLLGKDPNIDSMKGMLQGEDVNPFSMQAISVVAQKYDCNAVGVKTDINFLRAWQQPAIVHLDAPDLKKSHFCVLLKFEGDDVWMVDPPRQEPFKASIANLQRYWTRNALLVDIKPIDLREISKRAEKLEATPDQTTDTTGLIVEGSATWDLGAVEPGEYQHQFTLKNTGKSSLRIRNIRLSCPACMTAKSSVVELNPGDTAVLSVSVGVKKKPGEQGGAIFIACSDASGEYSYLSCNILARDITTNETKINLLPSHFILPAMSRKSVAEKNIQVTMTTSSLIVPNDAMKMMSDFPEIELKNMTEWRLDRAQGDEFVWRRNAMVSFTAPDEIGVRRYQFALTSAEQSAIVIFLAEIVER